MYLFKKSSDEKNVKIKPKYFFSIHEFQEFHWLSEMYKPIFHIPAESLWLCRCKHASYHSSTSGHRPCDSWRLSPWKHLKNRYENVTWGELCNDKVDLAPDAVYLLRWANRSLPALKTNISVLFIEQEKRFKRKWFDHLFEKAELLKHAWCILILRLWCFTYFPASVTEIKLFSQ